MAERLEEPDVEWITVPELAKRTRAGKEDRYEKGALYRPAHAHKLPATTQVGRRFFVNYPAFVSLSLERTSVASP